MTKIDNTCKDQDVKPLLDCLKGGGIADTEIDAGYGVFQRSEDGKAQKKIAGAHDGEISCEEIIESAVDNYKLCQDELKKLTKREVPWLLDETTKKRVSETIEKVESFLNKNEKMPDSDEYKKKMGIALYFFAYIPDASFMKSWAEQVAQVAGSLDLYGLAEFKDWLIKNGGLGLSKFTEDIKLEGTASEALGKKEGLCTEKAKIFYAVLEQANLKPYIALINGKDVQQAVNKAFFGGNTILNLGPEEELTGHVVVALDVGNSKDWFFEFQALKSPIFAAPYADVAFPLSLREFYQLELYNLFLDYKDAGEKDGAYDALWGADNLGNSSVSYRLIDILNMGEAPHLTLSDIEASLKIDPLNEWIKMLRCEALYNSGKKDDSAGCYKEMATKITNANYYKGRILFEIGKFEEAREAFFEYLKKADKKSEVYNWIGLTYLNETNNADAETYFKKAVETDALDAIYYDNLAATLKEQGKTDEATETLYKSLSLNPSGQVAYQALIDILISKNKFKEAFAAAEINFGYSDAGVNDCVKFVKSVYPDVRKSKSESVFFPFLDRMEKIYSEKSVQLPTSWHLFKLNALREAKMLKEAIAEAKKFLPELPDMAEDSDAGSYFSEFIKALNLLAGEIPADLLKKEKKLRETLIELYTKTGDAAKDQEDSATANDCYSRALKLKK